MIKTFGEATVELQRLLADGINLCENIEWIKFSKEHRINLQEKDLMLGDIYTYRSNIVSYRNDLVYYSKHYMKMDIKSFNRSKTYTTEDYFTNTVATKRERAVKALKILKKKTIDVEILSLLFDAINSYIELCIDVIKINPRLEGIRKRVGLEKLLEKYELMHIDMGTII